MSDTKLTRTRYDLLLETPDGGEEQITVEVRAADQMMAEQLAQRNGIGSLSTNPLSHTVTWVYAAAVREGKYAGEFQEFRQVLITFHDVAESTVPPTVEPSGSVSPLHFTTETPATG